MKFKVGDRVRIRTDLKIFEKYGSQLKQLKEEENKPILDDEEKEYLSVVIRPFKDKVKYIRKCCTSRGEYIEIGILNDSAILPYFNKNTMYKGMELEKQYTLKELGLDE